MIILSELVRWITTESSFIFQIVFSESFSVVVPLTSLVAPFRVESDEIMFKPPPVLLTRILLPGVIILRLRMLTSVVVLLTSILSKALESSTLDSAILA